MACCNVMYIMKQPNSRLGNGDASEIKRHVFFEGVKWDDVYNLKVEPPFRPEISLVEDT